MILSAADRRCIIKSKTDVSSNMIGLSRLSDTSPHKPGGTKTPNHRGGGLGTSSGGVGALLGRFFSIRKLGIRASISGWERSIACCSIASE